MKLRRALSVVPLLATCAILQPPAVPAAETPKAITAEDCVKKEGRLGFQVGQAFVPKGMMDGRKMEMKVPGRVAPKPGDPPTHCRTHEGAVVRIAAAPPPPEPAAAAPAAAAKAANEPAVGAPADIESMPSWRTQDEPVFNDLPPDEPVPSEPYPAVAGPDEPAPAEPQE